MATSPRTDITCGVPAKQFVRGEWFVVTAILTSAIFIFLRAGALGYELVLSLELVPATIIAFGFGFTLRMVAIWWASEEPMPRVPAHLLKGLPVGSRSVRRWNPAGRRRTRPTGRSRTDG